MVKILDCTLRDGGYLNNWWFTEEMAAQCYMHLSHSGINYIELGFLGTEEDFPVDQYGPFRRLNSTIVKNIINDITVPIAAMVDFGKHNLELPEPEESLINLIRVAVHKKNVHEAIDYCQTIKQKGYETSIQLMNYPSYSKGETNEVVHHIRDCPIDYTYIADSYGSMYPMDIPPYIERFRNLETHLGFHPHNNLQLAFANTLSALKWGIDIVDGTVFGMGRGAGNLPLEIIVAYMRKSVPNQFDELPILKFAAEYIMKEHQNNTWGYSLLYAISGIINCHPNYALELMQKNKDIDIESAYKALLKIVNDNHTTYIKGII
jgi:4-hydroxy 2-oxovalerate aldolase